MQHFDMENGSTEGFLTKRKIELFSPNSILLIWLCVSLSLLISAASLLLSIRHLTLVRSETTTNAQTFGSKPPIVCMECRILQTDASVAVEDDPLLKKLSKTHFMHDAKPKCCAYDSNQMSTLLEAAMRRFEPPQENLKRYNVSDFRFSPASAHLHFIPPKDDEKYRNDGVVFNRSLMPVRFEQPHKAFHEHTRGIGIMPEALKIHFPGLYIVYTSIEYKPDSIQPCESFSYQNWNHYVNMRSQASGLSRRLLQTAHTCCPGCTQEENTKYTMGVFYLNEGDEVSVEVMAYGLYNYSHDTSYLGVVMLGTQSNTRENH